VLGVESGEERLGEKVLAQSPDNCIQRIRPDYRLLLALF
jgi:hypothetical protein